MTLQVRALSEQTGENVACPGCDRERYATPGVYWCSECGTRFEVST